MAHKNPSEDPAEFERTWEALTESLGDLEVPAAAPEDVAPQAVVPVEREGSPATGPRDWVAPEVDEGHFEPPDPQLPPSSDPLATLGWILVAAGGIGALVALLARRVLDTFWLQIACGVLVVGVILVFWRLPLRRQAGHDDDSGAVV